MTRSLLARGLGVAASLALLAAGRVAWPYLAEGFDHPKHAKLFASCETCHAGAAMTGRPLWPAPASCVACHDGTIQPATEWQIPTTPHPSLLRFTHPEHARLIAARGDSAVPCVTCHERSGDGWMSVPRPVPEQCVHCHGMSVAHLEVPDTACATCHLTLAQAPTLPASRVAAFPAPASHRAEGFVLRGHGPLAASSSCATCHARDFCISCHVDAPEQRTIQALAPDARSLALRRSASLPTPASHREAGFERAHGALARRNAKDCAACHSQNSCLACHASAPAGARTLHLAGPGRGIGAVITRSRPASHGTDFRDNHGPTAAAAPSTCAACHARPTCLECHRPDPAAASGYHPANFLVNHPTAAYARQTACADCHNTAQFCTTCHAQSGLGTQGTLGTRARFHDGQGAFIVGHGQAARQSLESCVSCHVERDCLTCHSAIGGRRFNPHGPGFKGSRLRRKNPEMCTACHGTAIPE